MMAAAFAALGLPHTYDIRDVPPATCPRRSMALRRPTAGGANVTIPHKAAVAHLVDDISPDAAAGGRGQRASSATVTGSSATTPTCRRSWTSCACCDRTGSGGSCCWAPVAPRGRWSWPSPGWTARSSASPASDGSWDRLAELLATADLVINATPVGTAADESPVPAELLRPDLAVFDLVYRPSPTRLVREARAVGAPARAGGGMLLGQAWRSLELWLGVPAPIDAMRAALRRSVGEGVDA